MAPSETVSPTYVPDLVNASLDLLIDGEKGIWHLANGGEISWPQFAKTAALRFGLDPSMVLGVAASVETSGARVPVYSALASIHGRLLPDLHNALDRFTTDLEVNVYDGPTNERYLL